MSERTLKYAANICVALSTWKFEEEAMKQDVSRRIASAREGERSKMQIFSGRYTV